MSEVIRPELTIDTKHDFLDNFIDFCFLSMIRVILSIFDGRKPSLIFCQQVSLSRNNIVATVFQIARDKEIFAYALYI